MSQLRHEDLTYQLRGWMFDVRNKLKAGWPESVYHQALFEVIQANDVPVLYKPRETLYHREVPVHTFEPDLIVWNTIILELKALAYQVQFAGSHFAQLIHYLKFFRKDLGLLVNFGPAPIDIKRVVWDEPKSDIIENYSRIRSLITDDDKRYLGVIRQCVLSIAQQYGTGYPETVYRSLVSIDINHAGLLCQENAEIPAKWNEQVLTVHQTSHLLVAQRYLIHIRSLLEQPTKDDFARTKTYLSSLGLQIGLVVNFARTQIQIHGVKAD